MYTLVPNQAGNTFLFHREDSKLGEYTFSPGSGKAIAVLPQCNFCTTCYSQEIM